MLVKVLKICVSLWVLFAASIASAADLSDLSEAERKAFGEEVKRYLIFARHLRHIKTGKKMDCAYYMH